MRRKRTKFDASTASFLLLFPASSSPHHLYAPIPFYLPLPYFSSRPFFYRPELLSTTSHFLFFSHSHPIRPNTFLPPPPHFLIFSPFPHLLPLCSLRQLPIDLDLEDVEETAQQLLQALLLRHKYISSSLQTFFPTTNRFLRDIYQDSEIAAELNKESCCPNIMWLTSQQSKDKGEASLHLSLLVIVCK